MERGKKKKRCFWQIKKKKKRYHTQYILLPQQGEVKNQ